jgi:type II secretory pathway component PulF
LPIPVLELVSLCGFLCIFILLQLRVIPDIRTVGDQYGGRPPLPTELLFRIPDILQPPWLLVLVGIVSVIGMFILSQVWHAWRPTWPWIPLFAILGAGLIVLFFLGLLIGFTFWSFACSC